MDEELDVAVGAAQRRRHHVDHVEPGVAQAVAHLAEHRAVHVGIAHDAALADPGAAGFELRLHQQHELAVGRVQRAQRGRDRDAAR